MRKRKLRGYVLPTLYLMILGIMAFGITSLSKNLMNKKVNNDEYYNYSMSVFNETEETAPVMENETTMQPSAPFTSYSVGVEKDFYEREASKEEQEKSLIYYEGTYMPNTGILYSSNEAFEVVAVLDGTVKDIKEDEILGNLMIIEHENNLTTIYYTLGEIKVNVGDQVKQDDVIALAGSSKIQTSQPYTLLFETYLEGNLVNPITILDKTQSQ